MNQDLEEKSRDPGHDGISKNGVQILWHCHRGELENYW